MSYVKQPIFNASYSEELQAKLLSGESFANYYDGSYTVEENQCFESDIKTTDEAVELEPTPNADFESSIKLYEAYKDLDNTQASDKRFWNYLSHVTFKAYTLKRWTPKYSFEEANANTSIKKLATDSFIDRWFATGSSRSLRRHALARLWWTAHLTVAPWEKNPEEFGDLVTEDRYVYTRLVFTSQDILGSLLERKVGWSDKLVFASLEYFRRNPNFLVRSNVRSLMKELNLILSYRKITILPFESLISLVDEAAGNLK
jgi:hypothetical protein